MFSNTLHKTKTVDMTTGEIFPLIISFAVPLFIGNLFQQLYNTADCIIVGKFLGRDSLAAIGASTQFIFTMIGFFNGFSTGAQVVISQSFGAKNIPRLQKAIHTAVLSSFLISLAATAAGYAASPFVLRLIRVPESVFESAQTYLRIFFTGSAFLIFFNVGSAILRALGDSRHPLFFLIFSAAVNVILDLIFIFVFKWGIKGAAWATVISEAISTIPIFYVLLTGEDIFRLRLEKLRINGAILKEILKIGLPGAVSSSITAFSNTFMQKYVNVFGAACAAGWAVFSRFDQFIIMPMSSIAFAATTFSSQNYGAHNFDRIKTGFKTSARALALITLFTSTMLFIFSRFLTSLFISDESSINYGSLFIRYTAPFYILCGLSMLHSQVLRGLGDSIAPMLLTFTGFVLFRQIFLFTASHLSSSLFFVAITYPLAWPITSFTFSLYYRRKLKKISACTST